MEFAVRSHGVTVFANALPGVSEQEVLAALRDFGTVERIAPSVFRFNWHPVADSFETDFKAADGNESVVTVLGTTWRWVFDSNALTGGRFLARASNALRLLTVVSVLSRRVFSEWLAECGGVTLAYQGSGAIGKRAIVTEELGRLVGGDLGKELLAEMLLNYSERGREQDEIWARHAYMSSLIALFVEDQLAVRPPITQGEVDDLKRKLGINPDSAP